MEYKIVFNATVCIVGILFLLIHALNVGLKKNKRKDDLIFLGFVLLTAILFVLYFIYTIISFHYKEDSIVMASNTIFYIINNLEFVLFFGYAIAYIAPKKKVVDIARAVNGILFGIFIYLDLVNVFTPIFFYAKDGEYVRSKTFFLAQGYQFAVFAFILTLAMCSKKLKKVEKFAFLAYCSCPAVAIVLQDIFEGYAIGYLSIVFSIEILFLFVNVRKDMDLVVEERKNKDAEVKIMMSQIQPHFIYNVLASISTLIKIDPDKAQDGIDAFTDYLRANLSSLSDIGLIPFSEELRHIETYLELEKIRFDDRLNIVYHIECKDFAVPPLSLQPIVENAVKHGILKKIEGGTVIIRTYEKKDAYIVEITDDGIGFVPGKVDGKNHYGIKNVEYRLSSMCKAKMEVVSEINRGTTVFVKFFKEL